MSTQPHRKPRPSARTEPALPFEPRTIDYRCKRCGMVEPSQPLPRDPAALALYGLPLGWELGSSLEYELGPERDICPRDAEDFCLCGACAGDVRRGYPLDLRDFGRGRVL